MPEVLDIREYRRENGVATWLLQGTGQRLLVVFSGIGKVHEETQPYEFARSSYGRGQHNVLYVSDTNRSWLNQPGIIEDIVGLVAEVKARTGSTSVATLGHSMGGFMSAVLAGKLDADNAICLSPQNSVHPDIAGDDPRWQAFRNKINSHTIRDVASHMVDKVLYTVLFGRHGRELPQRERFPIRDNVDFYVMRNTVHNTPMRLKKAGLLDHFILAAANGRRRKVRQMMLEHFGTRPMRDAQRKPGSMDTAQPRVNASASDQRDEWERKPQ